MEKLMASEDRMTNCQSLGLIGTIVVILVLFGLAVLC
jgi:hypothetical protein